MQGTQEYELTYIVPASAVIKLSIKAQSPEEAEERAASALTMGGSINIGTHLPIAQDGFVASIAIAHDSGHISPVENRLKGHEAFAIPAECHTDDYAVSATFDALPWFEQATDAQILELAECGFGGDYPADAIADFMCAGYTGNGNLSLVFSYIHVCQSNGHKVGYECHVDQAAARKWLAENGRLPKGDGSNDPA